MSTQSQQNATAAFAELCKTMPLAGEGKGFNDQALPKAVRLAKLAGLSQIEAIKAILATQHGAKRDVEAEIRSTVERLYAAEAEANSQPKKKSKWQPFDRESVDDLMANKITVQ